MNAETKPTYEQWWEDRCNEGYYADEDWLNEEVEWELRKVMKEAGFFNKWEADLPHKQVMWHNNNQDTYWSVGGYDDNVTFSVCIDPSRMPRDHELRARFPFAFLAAEHGFAFDHYVHPAGRFSRSLTNNYQWTDGNYANSSATGDDVFSEGTVYDGMEWEEISKLMVEQTDDLLEVLEQYVDDVCNAVMRTIRVDYDYFFSEERYNEEFV